MTIKTIMGAVSACALSFSLASAAQAMPFDDVFIFGDSLIDSGNIAVVTGNTIPNPATGYFPGRFSDGPALGDWITFFATGNPLASPSLLGGNNFGFGGARIADNGDTVPDLALQVGAFGLSGIAADSNDLFVVNVGGNDIRDLTQAPDPIPPMGAMVYEDLADIVADQLIILEGLGAQNILLMGIPDVGTAPEQVFAGTSADATAASNFQQDAIVAELASRMFQPTTDLQIFDVIGLTDAVFADTEAFGLPPIDQLNTALPCQAVETPEPGIDCSGFLSFDGLHPTSQVLEVIGREALAGTFGIRISEPASLMLLGLGFAAIAGVRRRRAA